MTRPQADFVLLFSAALWGVAFYFQKDAMAYVGPWTFIASRAGLAVLVLAPMAYLETCRAAARPAPAGLSRLAAQCGAAFLAAAFLQQEGLRTASVTNTGFSNVALRGVHAHRFVDLVFHVSTATCVAGDRDVFCRARGCSAAGRSADWAPVNCW